MHRKGPLKPVRRQYSRDLKELVIYQTSVLGYSTTDVAISLNMSLRVVQRLKQTWEEVGEACKSRMYKGRPPLMSGAAVSVSTLIAWALRFTDFELLSQCMIGLIEQSPDIFLDEIHHQLYEMHEIDVSLSTIACTLKRLGYTSKQVCTCGCNLLYTIWLTHTHDLLAL